MHRFTYLRGKPKDCLDQGYWEYVERIGIPSMKIHAIVLHPYDIPLTNGKGRLGLLVCVADSEGNMGWGDVAPLPGWSKETLVDAHQQIEQKKPDIIAAEWHIDNCLQQLEHLKLLPSVSFGIESALLDILHPLPDFTIKKSALLMGSPNEILEQAKRRKSEGYNTTKLKVSNLTFSEAEKVINQLMDPFTLRIDVNRAWQTEDSLRFFSQYPIDAFEYVEEPFQNPYDLAKFSHSLAVDESYPTDLSLEQLEGLPTLKALIYKPTIQGGLSRCKPLHQWATERNIDFVLSSSFESHLGLSCIASLAHRLSLSAPIGIGTSHFFSS